MLPRRPLPPVLIGGEGPTVLDRVLAFGEGWMPSYSGEAVFERIKELRSRAQRHVEVQLTAVPADPRVLDRIRDAGVRRAMHYLPSGPRSTVEPALERWERAIAGQTGGGAPPQGPATPASTRASTPPA